MICTSVTGFRRRRWVVPDVDGAVVERLAQSLKLPLLMARLLVRRQMTECGAAAAFLDPKFKDLHSPYLLPNMHAAAERIAAAVRDKQKITIYGDYDVDGITGTAMLWHTLRTAGANVEYYISHWVDEGYGLNREAMQAITA